MRITRPKICQDTDFSEPYFFVYRSFPGDIFKKCKPGSRLACLLNVFHVDKGKNKVISRFSERVKTLVLIVNEISEIDVFKRN